jgi:DNA-binding MarR family transcriptional regulator
MTTKLRQPEYRHSPLSDPTLRDLLRLDAAWSAVSRVFDRALGGTGVSLPQALALTAIESAPQPLLLSGLAARLLQEAQSVTSLADRLERAGFARRVHDLPDRRAIRLELTDAGRAKVADLRPLLQTAAQQIYRNLGAQQSSALRETLSSLYIACRNYPGVRLPELPSSEEAG